MLKINPEERTKVDICPRCGLPDAACVCDEIAKTQQNIEVKTDKRRFGKIITLVTGFDKDVDIKAIAKTLKAKRACGGTVKNGIIELQGNHIGQITPILESLGFNREQITE
jgi:translation initiation factor 1